ncbi:WD domain and G-beta repeat containing protein, putative, partial [Ixodes scapularis]
ARRQPRGALETTALPLARTETTALTARLSDLFGRRDRTCGISRGPLSQPRLEVASLKQSLAAVKKDLQDMKDANQLLHDEHEALQLAYSSLERNFSSLDREHQDLIKRWMALKSRDADRLNAENERVVRLKQAQVKRDLEEAAREPIVVPGDSCTVVLGDGSLAFPTGPKMRGVCRFRTRARLVGSPSGGSRFSAAPVQTVEKCARNAACLSGVLPSARVWARERTSVPRPCPQEAHEGEVNAVRFAPSGKILCTGGGDRKLKVWEFSREQALARGTLGGSNAAVMSIDIDSEENLVLGASNDFSSRVWTMGDQRLRHTLTGHSGKVLAAKFLGESSRVASGSHDRTLKIWDLRSRACVRTIFAGSSCNDLVTSDGGGSTVISGHFDKRIRFWDTRAESSANEIVLGGRITSLDLSTDRCLLLCCVRDDSVKLLDVRMNQVLSTYGDDSFKVAFDWTRAKLSPDGSYIAAGSQDGTLFIWNTATAKLEKKLKEMSSAIIACAWSPSGDDIVSSDRDKRVCLWSHF